GCDKPDFESGVVAARVETKSACPSTMSAAGAFGPDRSADTGYRNTRLLPVSLTQRLPAASNARPVCPPRRRVVAFTPPLFPVDPEKVDWPMIRSGNWYPAGCEKGFG